MKIRKLGALDALRKERNARLAECDWTDLPNAPLAKEARVEWASYRQALRNITVKMTDPSRPTWPTPPKRST
jgi:hypothetical protein